MERVARYIHAGSRRARGEFVAVNCAALPEQLLESELFGHVRGAFTGADRDKKGLIDTASGGSLLLDEIGEIPLSVQVKLLRVLQDHEVRPVGGTTSRRIDVRIIAATNRDLMEMVRERAFRKDLYFRLKVLAVEVAPLHILRVLEKMGGNRKETARALGIGANTLWRKLRQYEGLGRPKRS